MEDIYEEDSQEDLILGTFDLDIEKLSIIRENAEMIENRLLQDISFEEEPEEEESIVLQELKVEVNSENEWFDLVRQIKIENRYK